MANKLYHCIIYYIFCLMLITEGMLTFIDPDWWPKIGNVCVICD